VKEYLDKMEKHFKATAKNINFGESQEAASVINGWIASQTNQKIKDLIPADALNALTRLVLVNAIYFKGDWASKFNKAATIKADFHVSPTETVKVDMMVATAEYAGEMNKELGCTILQVPYKGERLNMLFFLSDKPEGFSDMEKKFASFDFTTLNLTRKTKFEVSIPKFKLETSHSLNNPLKEVGMVSMFDAANADFTKLSEKGKDLYVSAVMQKAFIEVNEEGTEAAAATGAIVMLRMAVRNMQFHLNRPFIFAIKDNLTGLILFAGRIMNPNNA
jgi:serpin B